MKSPAPVPPPEKKPKKDNNKSSKKEKSPSTKVSKHSTNEKFAEMDSKWSERFSRLEALIMAKSFEPTFSSKVKVAPTHSPHDVENMAEPFIRPSTSKLTGTGFSAAKHQPTSQAVTSQQASTTKFPGTGFSANKHQPGSQTNSHRPTPATDPSTDPHSAREGDINRPYSDRPAATDRPLSSEPADTG